MVCPDGALACTLDSEITSENSLYTWALATASTRFCGGRRFRWKCDLRKHTHLPCILALLHRRVFGLRLCRVEPAYPVVNPSDSASRMPDARAIGERRLRRMGDPRNPSQDHTSVASQIVFIRAALGNLVA